MCVGGGGGGGEVTHMYVGYDEGEIGGTGRE